ncbi:MAG TPA: SDR family oxidoreductase [Polyangiaceae bacterium]|nr:SDR family oxidoreductase [Polyangiaceae bacterium]
MKQDQVAIVTGGASGIGRALSEELARRGVEVVVADIDPKLAEQVAAEIRAQQGRAVAKLLDVRDAEAFARLARETVERTGRIDYLFNNAGIGRSGEISSYALKDWDDVLDVNVRGVAYGVQAVYPLMIARGSGHIINTASTAGLISTPGLGGYSATKHAVVGLSKALRIEAKAHGVNVSVFCPGVIRTPLLLKGLSNYPGLSPEDASKLWERFRPMEPGDFARAALDCVAKNRAIIVVPRWYKALWFVERWSPALAERLGTLFHERAKADMEALVASAKNPPPLSAADRNGTSRASSTTTSPTK